MLSRIGPPSAAQIEHGALEREIAIGLRQAAHVIEHPHRHGLVTARALKLQMQQRLAPVSQRNEQHLIGVDRLRVGGKLDGAGLDLLNLGAQEPCCKVHGSQGDQTFERVIGGGHRVSPPERLL
jgi:hypothetical protein